MTDTAEQRHDADQDDALTALRIPVTCFKPDKYYLVTFDRESAERPTDREARIIASYIDFQAERWLSRRRQQERDQRLFDIEPGHNTETLHKRGPDQWAYRRWSWTQGYLFLPPWDDPAAQLGLVPLLDRMKGHTTGPNPEWEAWKSAHPDVFGEG